MRKVFLVLVVAWTAIVGATALATNAKKPRVCLRGQKALHCVDGRIVCCAPHDACDCGGGLPVR
jgi:hypothetical protein